MKTASLFFFLFLTGSIHLAAGTPTPISTTKYGFACDIPGGLAASNLTTTSALLSWNAVSGATQYTVEVEDEQNNPSVFHMETSVNSTSFHVTGLQAGVSYKFKVRTRCGGDKSDWSEWMFFTAENGNTSGNDTSRCAVVTGLTVSSIGGTATLGWNAVSGAAKYLIEIEDEQNTPSNFHLEAFSLTNTYTVTGLQTGVLYKFKVRAHCSAGQSDWSNWLFFNGNTGGVNAGGTGSCAKPTGALATHITAQSALLLWNAVPDVASYTVEIELYQSGTVLWQINQVVTTNSFLLTGLSPNTRYKFKVRSNCAGGGHSDWTDWRKFQTSAEAGNTPAEANPNDPAVNRDARWAATVFEVQVSPNPIQTTTTVRLQNLRAESTTLRLFNFAGRLVQEQYIQPEGGNWEGILAFGDLPNGLYLLQVQNAQNTRVFKLVVNH